MGQLQGVLSPVSYWMPSSSPPGDDPHSLTQQFPVLIFNEMFQVNFKDEPSVPSYNSITGVTSDDLPHLHFVDKM